MSIADAQRFIKRASREQSSDKIIDTETFDSFNLDFAPLDPFNYGIYLLKTEFIDIGNRSTVITQPVRLNEPPLICQPDRIFTPGSPITIKDINETTKSTDLFDKIEKMRYTIYREGFDPISSGFLLQTDKWDKISDNKNLVLYHSDNWIPETVYTLKIEAYDTYDKKAEATREITIVNTKEGQLYTDEYWIGTHSLTDKVIVPDGLKLHIHDDTAILAMAGSTYGTRQELLVMPGAELIHYGSAIYKSGGDPFAKWEGLDIRGKANLASIQVSDARRAIVLNNCCNTEIEDCIIIKNNIGLHLYNSSPTVSGCTFSNNRYYGVKEDGTAVPVFSNNIFTGNGMDYYDTNLTETTLDELNQLGANSGNEGDEE